MAMAMIAGAQANGAQADGARNANTYQARDPSKNDMTAISAHRED